MRERIDEKSRIDTYRGSTVVVRDGTSWQLGSSLVAAQKLLDRPPELFLENSSQMVKLDDRKQCISRERRCKYAPAVPNCVCTFVRTIVPLL